MKSRFDFPQKIYLSNDNECALRTEDGGGDVCYVREDLVIDLVKVLRAMLNEVVSDLDGALIKPNDAALSDLFRDFNERLP